MPIPNVTHVISSLETGGAQKVLLDLVRAGNGAWQHHVVGLAGGPYADRFRAAGVPVTVLGNSSRSPQNLLTLRRHLHQIGPNLVHAHLFPASLWVSLLASITPTVYTEHSQTTKRRGNVMWRYIDTFQYTRFSAVTAVSESAAEALTQWIPLLKNRVSIIYNGVPEVVQPPSDQERDLDVLFVGRLVPNKGCDILLRALALLRDEGRLPSAAIIGGGPAIDGLRELARGLKLPDSLFQGPSDGATDWMVRSRIVVVPSRAEAFGLVAVEAMANGAVPVVAETGGLREIVNSGVTGLSFPQDDHVSLARCIDRLLTDAALRSELTRNANHVYRERYTVSRMCQGYERLYRELLSLEDKRI